MRDLKIIILTLLLLSIGGNIKAQNTCSTPYLFESGNTYTNFLDTNVTNSDSLDFNCLVTQPNPVWYYFGGFFWAGSF